MTEIIFEDESLIVFNKPAGLVVNNSVTTKGVTLQSEVAGYLKLKDGDLGIGDRAGIVHRLDRETSGLIVVAKTQKAFVSLQEQFESRKVKKTYIALVHGHIKLNAGEINLPIARIGKFGKFGISKGGRESSTLYKIQKRFVFKQKEFDLLLEDETLNLTRVRRTYLKKQAVDYTLVTLIPKTGRTHQIRVHLKSLGHPIVSDLIYEPAKLLKFDQSWCSRLFLHSSEIEFVNPKSKKRLTFKVGLPVELLEALKQLTI